MSYSTQLTPNTSRVKSIDALRGVAVSGILVMNIYAFAMPMSAYSNPLVWGGTEFLNIATWFATHVLFDQKFMTIFSILFGAGVILMTDRADAKGVSFTGVFYRRQFWLLLIGMAHAYLIWFGDILVSYALIGMIVYACRHWPPKKQIVVACSILPVALLLMFGGGTYMQDLKLRAETYSASLEAGDTLSDEHQAVIDEWSEARGFVLPGPEEVQKDLDAYGSDYASIFQHRAPFVLSFQTDGFLFFIVWRVSALMLLGMALMRLGILDGSRSAAFYRNFMLAAYGLGLPLAVFSAANLNAHGFDALYAFRIGGIPNYFGSIFTALGHIGLVMLIVKSGVLKSVMERFSALGRMALTNYLLHSIVLTSVFYGYGLSLYGEIPRFWQMGFVAGVIGLQLVVSPLWLARYRFGPAEWLWRTMTYWERQPMRR